MRALRFPGHPRLCFSRPSTIQKCRLGWNSCLAPSECLRCGARQEPGAKVLPLGESDLPSESQRPIKTRGKTAFRSPRAPQPAAPGSHLASPPGPQGAWFPARSLPPRPPASDSSNIAARLLSLCSGGQARAEGRRHQRGKQLPDFRFNCWEER